MNEQENTKIVRQAYEHFKAGDIESLLDLYSDDVTWQLPEMENVLFAGTRSGRESVREFISIVNNDLEALEFEPTEFIAQDDKVVALRRYHWRVKATCREYESDWAHVCTLRDGKIVSFHEYMDTAAASRAHTAAQTA